MPVSIVRFGTPRMPDEGVRLGTVRHPPRGVKKAAYASSDYYDVWLPELAPGAPLVAWAMGEPFTDERWARFARDYRREMKAPPARNLIAALAALSLSASFAVGCYCPDESRCHRSLLRELLQEAGATLA